MPLPMQVSLNAVLMLIIGIVLLAGGVYMGLNPRMRLLAVGMLLTAVGCVFCGITDGFTDPTPRGKLFFRFGVVGFLTGIPILAYAVYSANLLR